MGRMRLWVEYRRGGVCADGRGRHHVASGGYFDQSGDDEDDKWRTCSTDSGCSIPWSATTPPGRRGGPFGKGVPDLGRRPAGP